MKPTLNASLLIRNLRDTEDQSVQPARLPACLADAGDGVSYLFIPVDRRPGGLFHAARYAAVYFEGYSSPL